MSPGLPSGLASLHALLTRLSRGLSSLSSGACCAFTRPLQGGGQCLAHPSKRLDRPPAPWFPAHLTGPVSPLSGLPGTVSFCSLVYQAPLHLLFGRAPGCLPSAFGESFPGWSESSLTCALLWVLLVPRQLVPASAYSGTPPLVAFFSHPARFASCGPPGGGAAGPSPVLVGPFWLCGGALLALCAFLLPRPPCAGSAPAPPVSPGRWIVVLAPYILSVGTVGPTPVDPWCLATVLSGLTPRMGFLRPLGPVASAGPLGFPHWPPTLVHVRLGTSVSCICCLGLSSGSPATFLCTPLLP